MGFLYHIAAVLETDFISHVSLVIPEIRSYCMFLVTFLVVPSVISSCLRRTLSDFINPFHSTDTVTGECSSSVQSYGGAADPYVERNVSVIVDDNRVVTIVARVAESRDGTVLPLALDLAQDQLPHLLWRQRSWVTIFQWLRRRGAGNDPQGSE